MSRRKAASQALELLRNADDTQSVASDDDDNDDFDNDFEDEMETTNQPKAEYDSDENSDNEILLVLISLSKSSLSLRNDIKRLVLSLIEAVYRDLKRSYIKYKWCNRNLIRQLMISPELSSVMSPILRSLINMGG
ncbi:hypothetical protein BpHYR1_035699 [Brachionus plicatilis]|uniref:Uncharacterized protein n=1 Tax=Brachionus plicatilis TaxID=10195 RepID=A0A3M7Q1K8_BRAPC|nr:hypothetical protein BpHYR1_035699 [Brachionus plicatilis]